MKCGDLVKIKKSRIGTPAGTLGLVVETFHSACGEDWDSFQIHAIKLANGRTIRRTAADLEVISCK
jgi:hypothetical protein